MWPNRTARRRAVSCDPRRCNFSYRKHENATVARFVNSFCFVHWAPRANSTDPLHANVLLSRSLSPTSSHRRPIALRQWPKESRPSDPLLAVAARNTVELREPLHSLCWQSPSIAAAPLATARLTVELTQMRRHAVARPRLLTRAECPAAMLTAGAEQPLASLCLSLKASLLHAGFQAVEWARRWLSREEGLQWQQTRQRAPLPLRERCWRRFFGPWLVGRCFVCGGDLSAFQFHCSHIVARAAWGPTHVSNLVPLCSSCNGSVGSDDVLQFMDTQHLPQLVQPWPTCAWPCCWQPVEGCMHSQQATRVCSKHRHFAVIVRVFHAACWLPIHFRGVIRVVQSMWRALYEALEKLERSQEEWNADGVSTRSGELHAETSRTLLPCRLDGRCA